MWLQGSGLGIYSVCLGFRVGGWGCRVSALGVQGLRERGGPHKYPRAERERKRAREKGRGGVGQGGERRAGISAWGPRAEREEEWAREIGRGGVGGKGEGFAKEACPCPRFEGESHGPSPERGKRRAGPTGRVVVQGAGFTVVGWTS